MIDPDILQAIRRSHCDLKEKDHACVGTISITPSGIKLDCGVCGKGEELDEPLRSSDAARRVRDVLSVAGIDYDKLAPQTQAAAVKEMARDLCPGCRRLRTVSTGMATFYHCPCGGWMHSGIAWRKEEGR